MQQLLSCAAGLPSLLESARRLEDVGSDIDNTESTLQDLWNSLNELLLVLDTWVRALEAKVGLPLHWNKEEEIPGSEAGTAASGSQPFPSLWFQTIWVANSMSHLWTFEVIILTEIKKLNEKCCNYSSYIPPKDVIELSTLICRSMEYLSQDSMRLYGPAFTFLPLWTASNTFRSAGACYSDCVDWCQRIGEGLLRKGLSVVAYQLGN